MLPYAISTFQAAFVKNVNLINFYGILFVAFYPFGTAQFFTTSYHSKNSSTGISQKSVSITYV